jgi:hypothetical protein
MTTLVKVWGLAQSTSSQAPSSSSARAFQRVWRLASLALAAL